MGALHVVCALLQEGACREPPYSHGCRYKCMVPINLVLANCLDSTTTTGISELASFASSAFSVHSKVV
jgi:hypothetical protein